MIEGEAFFNSYMPDAGLDFGQDTALYLNPINIREVLTNLSDPETLALNRASFFELNPILGARWVEDSIHGPVLQNMDQIWPVNYDVTALTADVHAYSILLTRAGNRLPRSFLVNFEWSG